MASPMPTPHVLTRGISALRFVKRKATEGDSQEPNACGKKRKIDKSKTVKSRKKVGKSATVKKAAPKIHASETQNKNDDESDDNNNDTPGEHFLSCDFKLEMTNNLDYTGPTEGSWYVLPACRWYTSVCCLIPVDKAIPDNMRTAFGRIFFEQLKNTKVKPEHRQLYEEYAKTENGQMDYTSNGLKMVCTFKLLTKHFVCRPLLDMATLAFTSLAIGIQKKWEIITLFKSVLDQINVLLEKSFTFFFFVRIKKFSSHLDLWFFLFLF
jgi:hypothetical protein